MNGLGGEQHQPYRLLERAIDDLRPMRVIVIGCGVSGMTAAIRFPQYTQNVEFVVYESESDIGGTWHVNRYPGISCDIPAHCYQFTFEPNPEWSAFYAPGHEIQAYLRKIADKYQILKYVKLNHRVQHAEWDAETGKWKVQVLNRITNEVINDSADLVLSTTGGLSRWKWPDIEGLRDFEGQLMHSASYNIDLGIGDLENEEQKKWKDKKVALIGVGSSAIQILPCLQKVCDKVVNFVRGKTWIATPFASKFLLERQPDGSNHLFTKEEIKEFKDDPEYYYQWRKALETELNSIHGATLAEHPLQQEARKAFKELMQEKLKSKSWIADHLIPDFPVACRRLTPGPGFLEALLEDNVEFVPTLIKRATKTGIELVDGTHHEFDIIICATGFDISYKPEFNVIGRNGLTMAEAREPYPKSYLSLATRGFPNWFETFGPNSAIGSGSLLIMLERQVEYAIKATKKLQKERYKSLEVKQEAVDDFDEYVNTYFPRTVFGQKCRSWYKMGKEEGRVVALWPGSCLHSLHAFESPRWEDFEYESLDKGQKNRFYYMGNGWTENERLGVGDRAPYLDGVDYPPVPSTKAE